MSSRLPLTLLGGCLLALTTAGPCAAQQNAEEVQTLRTLVQQQQQQIEQLTRRMNVLDRSGPPRKETVAGDKANPIATLGLPTDLDAGGTGTNANGAPAGQDGGSGSSGGSGQDGNASGAATDKAAIRNEVIDFLKENPGAGMPPGVQTGFEAGRGFFLRSVPNPPYVKWQDEARIPFELRIRGRMQLAYDYYNVNDNLNHLTGNRYEPEVGDFSQLEAKRMRLIFEGHLFEPTLRYQFQLDASTRGFGIFQNNRVLQTAGLSTPAASLGAAGIGGASSITGGGDTADNAVRLFTAWVAYDIPLGDGAKGCGPDCGSCGYSYTPTLSFIVGKQQPYFSLMEILGSANAQFAEFAMADWFFDADDNNMLTAVSAQYRGVDDRLLVMTQLTNGSESAFPNVQMDNLPGFIACTWYDFGGSYDQQAKRWNLFGDSIADLNYSVKPTVRVGGACNLVWLGRRSIYGDLEQSRYQVVPGAPGGTRLINLLNGDSATPAGSHAVDKFDAYSFDFFVAGHYRGWSLYNEWYLRDLTNFHTDALGNNQIIYQDGSGANALFPRHALIDLGTTVQCGYFVVPKRFELMSRYSWIAGDSGDINGNGKFTTTRVAGAAAPVRVIDDAFRNFHTASETAVGFNYYWYGQLVKWTTDLSFYQGGNPAANGASPAGYIPGVDGWLVRTQLQVAF